ncbi:hypothetical protein RHMOL_Rhmol07G0059700 [Rhododendron molle]|uniref:Uncharacterized protein n=5 Tax=Rhododendron molle TaxID=49168 RepID=A0ACC0MXD3_RHOML|nr:hypothetical protein RHMOL_Rhmol07G0059700 [Rhododendron molle]KAI8545706.1 hypothetical protein RHMOL_Rhmol07G0059700 [Rhododendron molle]KAI8545707.1 hypothetical protein RHMOL_Rhmol07G0059700 [Rhododendron molle]KAI8545708.1 hypothetical protein RHMOL_Rhmol07G0059700 [Rhododendron molle]KAI8545709.1 hypothetical protein RHMOL_Rhmol07G0059700 [Rhododendron molle]
MRPKLVSSSLAGPSPFTPISTTPRHRERDDEEAFDVLNCIAFTLMDAQWLVMPVWNLMIFSFLMGSLFVVLIAKDRSLNHVLLKRKAISSEDVWRERERKRGRSFWANNPTPPPPQLTPNDARSLLSSFTHEQLLSVVQSVALCHPNVFSAFGTSGHLRPDRISSLRNPRPLEAANEMKIDL